MKHEDFKKPELKIIEWMADRKDDDVSNKVRSLPIKATGGLKSFVPIIDYKIYKWLHKISKICLQAFIIDVVP